jgi:hypothetical protein
MGAKIFNQNYDTIRDNTFDFLFESAFPITLKSQFVIRPSINITWSYLQYSSVGNQTSVWFSLDVAVKTFQELAD